MSKSTRARSDAELAGQLSDGLFGAVRMQRRPEGVALAQRLEHTDRLGAPEIDRQVRAQLVAEKERLIGTRLLQVVERLHPPAQEDAPDTVGKEIEEGGERRRLSGVRLLSGDEHRAVRVQHHSAQRDGARIHVPCFEELDDRHGDRRLPVPSPPTHRHVVVARRQRMLDERSTTMLHAFGLVAEPSTLSSALR